MSIFAPDPTKGLAALMHKPRPAYGTPPIAPTPGEGMDPAMAPAPQQHGIAGFLERAFNPTNALGQFGQALVASGGGPLGNAMAYMMQQRADKAHAGDKFGEWKQQYDYELGHPKPHDPTGFSAELMAAGIDPASPEGQKMLRQKVDNSLDPWITFSNPDGSYFGPRGGLASALGGSAPAQPAAPARHLGSGDKPDWSLLGGGASNGPGTFPVKGDYGNFKRSIIGQESGGRYGVANAEGSGAMGIGQVMPDTARVLAGRLGMPWNPNMMASTSVAGKRYQDAITEAAAQEAWKAGAGNPETAAMYYHGGSNRQGWGPKTHRYARDVLGRMGGH